MPDYSINSSENLIGLVWYAAPSMSGVDDLEAVFDRVARGCSRRIGFATRLTRETVAKGATPEVREGLSLVLRRFGPRIAAAVVIYEETGVRAAFVRTVISTINLISRAQFRTEVHSNLLQGCMWMMGALGTDAPVDGEKRLLKLLPSPAPLPADLAKPPPRAAEPRRKSG